MNIFKFILKIMILIDLFLFSCKRNENFKEEVYSFKGNYLSPKTFPVYPGAEPDFSYARVGVYVISYVYGWDPEDRVIFAYYTEDKIEEVKDFYEKIYKKNFNCEIIDHNEFIRLHWDLFQEYEFKDTEGFFEHCKGPKMDLISPVYHYGSFEWKSGTMIIFHVERFY